MFFEKRDDLSNFHRFCKNVTSISAKNVLELTKERINSQAVFLGMMEKSPRIFDANDLRRNADGNFFGCVAVYRNANRRS